MPCAGVYGDRTREGARARETESERASGRESKSERE